VPPWAIIVPTGTEGSPAITSIAFDAKDYVSSIRWANSACVTDRHRYYREASKARLVMVVDCP
jgi:hypothetical protein